MFAEARKAKMDLGALGEQLAARKGELQAQISSTAPGARRGRASVRHRLHGAGLARTAQTLERFRMPVIVGREEVTHRAPRRLILRGNFDGHE